MPIRLEENLQRGLSISTKRGELYNLEAQMKVLTKDETELKRRTQINNQLIKETGSDRVRVKNHDKIIKKEIAWSFIISELMVLFLALWGINEGLNHNLIMEYFKIYIPRALIIAGIPIFTVIGSLIALFWTRQENKEYNEILTYYTKNKETYNIADIHERALAALKKNIFKYEINKTCLKEELESIALNKAFIESEITRLKKEINMIIRQLVLDDEDYLKVIGDDDSMAFFNGKSYNLVP